MTIQDVQGRTLEDLGSLEGRVAVVTGAARGNGYAISWRLAEAGAHVFVADINEPGAQKAADRMTQEGYKATAAVVDAADSGSLGALADRALAEGGRLDVWVNNAGIFPVNTIEMSDEEWKKVVDLDLSGVFYGSREAALRMREAGSEGVIVNVASTNGYRAGGSGLSHYVASKHGVIGLTKSLAVELAPDGIRTVAVAPALVDTEGIEGAADDLSRIFGADPREAFAKMLPAGRIAVPDDVARVVTFLASDMAAFMTGTTIPIDGGFLAA